MKCLVTVLAITVFMTGFASVPASPTAEYCDQFHREWADMGKSRFMTYVNTHVDHFNACPEPMRDEARGKWGSMYTEEFWPDRAKRRDADAGKLWTGTKTKIQRSAADPWFWIFTGVEIATGHPTGYLSPSAD
jgi:hypothetical protein